jgi:hypothetical protein
MIKKLLNQHTIILSLFFCVTIFHAQSPSAFTWQDVITVDFGLEANHFNIKAASEGSGGELELRLDAANGPVIGRVYFNHTGSSLYFLDYECDLKQTLSGVHDVYMNFQDYSEPTKGGVLQIGNSNFDFIKHTKLITTNRLQIYPFVSGLEPSPYYEYQIQKVSALNSANLASVSN